MKLALLSASCLFAVSLCAAAQESPESADFDTKYAQSLVEDMKKTASTQQKPNIDLPDTHEAQRQTADLHKTAQTAYEFRTEFWKDKSEDLKKAVLEKERLAQQVAQQANP